MRDLILEVWPDGGYRTIIDLGCRDAWHTAGLPGVNHHVGVDAWPPALERGREKAAGGHIPGFDPRLSDALLFLIDQETESFDAVLAIDILEHCQKPEALLLVQEMERVAKHLAVVWTTLGMIPQEAVDVDGNLNPFERHVWGPDPTWFSLNARNWRVSVHEDWHGDRGGAIFAWVSKS